MAIDVAVYEIMNNGRSRVVCDAMSVGIKKLGDRPVRYSGDHYKGPAANVAVFYGYTQQLRRTMSDYRKLGGAVYIDLGYWGRHDGGRRAGYHKISLNARHPTEYFMRRPQPRDRFEKFKIEIKPWQRDGEHILVAGMSAKGAEAEGFDPEQWEKETIAALKKFTNRRIVYRPKPNWKHARPLAGTDYSPPKQSPEQALVNCHAVVSHHSNVLIDGLISGVPGFCSVGVAVPVTLRDLSRIDDPIRPENREQWAADVAYCQWSVAEMAMGLPWRHLKHEGLIP